MALNIPGVPNLKSTESTKEGPEDATGGDPSDLLFFNVMPKTKAGSEIIDPKIISVDTEPQKVEQNAFKRFFFEHKLYFIVGGIILILAVVAYFIFDRITKSQYKPDDLIVKGLNPIQKPKASSTPETTTGFTTDKAWRDKFFDKCQDIAVCGDVADPDQDGLTNLQEFKLDTDPNNKDSDQDGLSDGDEVNVFLSDPLKNHSAGNDKFTDSDYVKGGFSFATSKKMSPEEIRALGIKMTTVGLHSPTIETLGDVAKTLYDFGNATPLTSPTPTNTPSNTNSSSSPVTLDTSIGAKQDRDTKRANTIKNIEEGLVKYQADNGKYPVTASFDEMFSLVKPYLKVATNPRDPLNLPPNVYSYNASSPGLDFTLTFYSEVANGPISKHAADAKKDYNTQTADTNDNKRISDLEDLRTALLLYSNQNAAGNQEYVFPPIDKYKTALVPDFIQSIPKDPKTNADYDYQPSKAFDAFTLKAVFENPQAGNTGYICNQIEECRPY